MLLSVSRPTEKFTLLIGLRSLLVSGTAIGGGRGGGGILTRTTTPASHGACGGIVQESGDGGGGGGVVTRTMAATCGGEVVQESGDGEGDEEENEEEVMEEDEGCWVLYGRRDPRRRLPPPIPSLAARSTLRRARTEDRRIVITKMPIMRPDYYVRARRRGGRLTMQLVEREDDSDPLPAAADPLPAPSAREDDIAQVDNSTTTATATAVEEDVHDVHTAAVRSPLPAVGCFDDVVKYQYSIGSSPLHQMHMLRMVH